RTAPPPRRACRKGTWKPCSTTCIASQPGSRCGTWWTRNAGAEFFGINVVARASYQTKAGTLASGKGNNHAAIISVNGWAARGWPRLRLGAQGSPTGGAGKRIEEIRGRHGAWAGRHPEGKQSHRREERRRGA